MQWEAKIAGDAGDNGGKGNVLTLKATARDDADDSADLGQDPQDAFDSAVTGLDEVPNTCAWFGPKYSGNLYNWWPTGFSCGELNMTEEYNGRVGTRLNNSVIIAPTMAGSTADAYINYLSIRSGWLIPYAKNISNDVKLRVQAGEIANPAVLQTYDRGRDWEGFEISGQTVLAGVTYGVTGSGLLTLSGQPDIRFNAGTRISCISGVSGDGATLDNF